MAYPHLPLISSLSSPLVSFETVSPMAYSFCLGDGRGKVDPRLAEVVRYRLGRKESHSMAAGVLEEFLSPTPPAAPAKTPDQEQGEEQGGQGEQGEQVEDETVVDGGGE